METMNYEEAAAYLKIKVNTLKAWVAKKKLPFHKPSGKTVLFFREELEKWILEGEQNK